ncbi:ethanolamine ammonia-lyase subunit EutC [Anaerotignum sp.]|nr:ethanolamine ammonia-lyase subunit EutC [Anaerotignum sp.]MBQ7758059.1 ethanolamine ammonia-lyase subunit EutC [Anaerotignum sp.]
MLGKAEIDRIAEEIIVQMQQKQDGKNFDFEMSSKVAVGGSGIKGSRKTDCAVEVIKKNIDAADLQSAEEKDNNEPLLEKPEDPDALRRMMTKTIARIGVGKSGPRLKTKTMLALRADHAAARDAVMMDVSEELVAQLGLLPLVTKCSDKNEFLTRPDLGRDFSDDMKKNIVEKCKPHPDVQIIVSDGLSSTAIEANAARILPVVMDGLQEKGITVGTPVFVKFGRVGAQDRISELLDAKIVCSFIGERPGLATAESMSAYITYRAEVGMPEARRTVVSNIHKNGVPAVEAGAYIVDLLQLMLEQKASGLDLKK